MVSGGKLSMEGIKQALNLMAESGQLKSARPGRKNTAIRAIRESCVSDRNVIKKTGPLLKFAIGHLAFEVKRGNDVT